MKKSDLYLVSLKIFGLYLFIRFIINLKDFLFLVIGNTVLNDEPINIWFFGGLAFTAVVELGIGYILIFKTESVINKISGSSPFATLSVDRTALLEVAIAILSIVLITYSAAELLSYFVESTYFHDHKESEYLVLDRKKPVFYAAFKLVAGIFLLFNTRHFSNLIIKLGERSDRNVK